MITSEITLSIGPPYMHKIHNFVSSVYDPLGPQRGVVAQIVISFASKYDKYQ